jgi:hypothetical protein
MVEETTVIEKREKRVIRREGVIIALLKLT